jgi:hypothetical protein
MRRRSRRSIAVPGSAQWSTSVTAVAADFSASALLIAAAVAAAFLFAGNLIHDRWGV